MDGMGHGNTRLSTRWGAEMNERFSAAAARQDPSESALLKRLVEQMLSAAPVETDDNPPRPSEPGGDPPSARRSPFASRTCCGSEDALQQPTFIAPVRAHLRSLTPVPKEELAELRRSIAELNAVGRSLNQIARVRMAEPERPCCGGGHRRPPRNQTDPLQCRGPLATSD